MNAGSESGAVFTNDRRALHRVTLSPGLTGNSEAPWAVEVTYFREIGHLLSCPTLCDPIDCSLQASPSMGFFRQEYQSGFPFPFPGDLPNLGIEPGSPALQADALPSEPPGKPSK